MDGWLVQSDFALAVGEATLSSDATWKAVWENNVAVIVSILTPEDKVSEFTRVLEVKHKNRYENTERI